MNKNVLRSFVTVGRSNIVITCMENNISLNMDFLFFFFQVKLIRPIECVGGCLLFLRMVSYVVI